MVHFVSQAWPFVHPALAAGAVAAGLIPVAIHWLNRRRYRRAPWAAMQFLRIANEQQKTRLWFERWLLLLLRIAVIVLAGLAIARPFFPLQKLGALTGARAHHIIAIDDSLSMQALDANGRSRFERAREIAQALVQSFPETDAVSLVTLAKPARAIVRFPSTDRRYIREQLAELHVSEADSATPEGLNLVKEIVRASYAIPVNRTVYIFSDFTAKEWQGASQSTSSETMAALRGLADELANPALHLQLVQLSEERVENLSLTSLELESSILGPETPVRLTAIVKNTGTSTARGGKLTVRRSEEGRLPASSDIRQMELAPIEPGQTVRTNVSIAFSSAGVHSVEARLSAAETPQGRTKDALQVDDVRYLSVETRDATLILLVDGRMGPTTLTGQAGFLATALSPRAGAGEAATIKPKIMTDTEFSTEPLREYDVIALCNVSHLPAAQWARVEDFVRRGGGLLVFAGDQLSVDNYNRFAHKDGRGLLPAKLSQIKSFEDEDSVNLKLGNPESPLVAELVGEATSGLFSARVSQYLSVDPASVSLSVPLRYSNEDPALITGSLGKGRVVLCTTTANMDWTNLPAKGDFVTLMLNTVAFLAPPHGQARNAGVGDVIVEPLRASESSFATRLTSADGSTWEGRLKPVEEGLAAEFGPLNKSGAYRMIIGTDTKAVAVNTNSSESELVPTSEQEFKASLNRPVKWFASPDAVLEKRSTAGVNELATFALYLVLALVIAETWIAMHVGATRKAPSRALLREPINSAKPMNSSLAGSLS